MKKTGAMILSFMLIFMMTVTNLAGAYHSAAQVYAAEETDGGEDNTDGGTQGGDETALTNTALPTGDVTQSGNQVTTITPPQETAPATTFTVTFDANGHGTAPDAVTVTEGSTAPKPDDLTAEGFMFDGWFRDSNATVEWNFDTDTVNENITLYAGWTENLPAPTLQSNAEITSSTQGDANTENNNAQEGATTSNAGNTASTAQEGATTSNAGNTASTAQEGTTTSDAGNTGSNAKDEKTTTPDAGNTAGAEQEGAKPANDKNEEDNNKTTFTVIFDANGHGTTPASVTVEEGDTIPTPKAPEADGFIFTGWYTEPEARNIWNFEKDTVSGNLTLYAEWQKMQTSALRGVKSGAPALRGGAIIASGSCGSNVTWKLDQDGVFTISGTGAMSDYDLGTRPEWDTYKDKITSVVIENGVTTVGEAAFYKTSLQSVSIPASVTTIKRNAFRECSNLSAVTFSNNSKLATIEIDAFNLSGIGSIILPDGVTDIGIRAFIMCRNLTGITIPKSVTSIGASAFSSCSSLQTVTFTGTQEQWDAISGNTGIGSGVTVITTGSSPTPTTYAVTFDTKGGTPVPSKQTVKHGESPVAVDAPSKDNVGFKCWTKDGQEIEDITQLSITKDTVLVAKYEVAVGIYTDGNGTVDTSDAYNVQPGGFNNGVSWNEDEGAEMWVWAKPNNGFIFKEWRYANRNEIYSGENPVYVKANAHIALRAVFMYEQTHNVTLVLNGGTWSGTNPEVIHHNELFGFRNPDRQGYTFRFWCTDEALTIPFDFKTTPVTTDLTLYAKWAKNCIGTVELNGGKMPGLTQMDAYEGMEIKGDYFEVDILAGDLTPPTGFIYDGIEITDSAGTKVLKTTSAETYTVTEDFYLKILWVEKPKQPQTIGIRQDDLSGLTYGDGPVTLSLSEPGAGTGAVTWTSSDPSVLSIDGTTATILKAGTVTVTASKEADVDYGAAEDTCTVTVVKKQIAESDLSLRATDITYGQTLSDSVLTCTGHSFVTVGWADGNAVPAAGNAVSCAVTAEISGSDTEKYELVNAQGGILITNATLNVLKATPAVTISVKKDTAGTTVTLTATVQKTGKGLAPTGTVKFEYSADSGTTWITVPSGDAVTLVTGTDGNASTTCPWDSFGENTAYMLRVTYSGDGNYNGVNGNTTFDPRKQDQSALKVEPSKADPVYGDILTFSTSGGSGDGAVSFDISPAGQDVLRVESVDAVHGTATVTILKAGTVTVTATKDGGTAYNDASASVSVTVKKAALTFTAENKTVNKGDPMPALTFATKGLVDGDTVSGDPSLTTPAVNTDNAGDFVIKISGGTITTKDGAAWTDCYDAVYKNGTLAVKNMYSVTVTPSPSAGGTVTGGGTYAEGEPVSVTATANSGYRFSRWLEGGTAVSGNTTYTFTASGTRDLVAEFVQNATVTSVTVTPSPVDVIKGKTQQFTAQVAVSGAGSISKTVTWSVSGAGSSGTKIDARTGELSVAANETATVLTVKATSDADPTKTGTATVNVKENVPGFVTVTFDAKGGTGVASRTVTKGSTISAPTSTRAGYILVGWFDPDDKPFDFSKPVNADVQLTAKWKSDAVVTGITVSPASAEVVIDRAQQKDGSQQFTAKVEGNGAYSSAVTWSVSGNKSTKTTISAEGLLTVGADETAGTLTVTVVSDENASVKATAAVTVTEKQPDTYTVKFDANGGSAVASQQVKKNEKAVIPADPTRSGYTFKGWNLNGKPYDFNTPVTSDITLTADWKQNDSTELSVDARGFTDADIPQSLVAVGYDTTGKIQGALLQAVVDTNGSAYGKNYALYEVVLMVSFDGGKTWVAATPENFPEGGITVEIPYPSGTNGNTHNFVVAHMFTMHMHGHEPGKIENPNVTKRTNGIRVTLDGLSPVLVAWTEISNQSNPTNPSNPSNPSSPSGPTNPGGGGGSGGGSGSGSGSTPSPQATGSEGQNATGGTDTVATRTNVSGARSASGAQNTNARGGQTGDDMYERLGLHTLVLLAALLLLIAQLRKLMEENMLLAINASCSVRKIPDSGSGNQKRNSRVKRAESGLEFIEMNTVPKSKPRAKRSGRNKGFTKGNR